MSGCIICGLDGSPAVSEAVLVARWLSRRLACRLLLVNVARVPVVPGASGVPHAYDDLREDAVDEARGLLERTCEEHGLGGAAEQRILLGDPVERLGALAEEEGAALLVVGTRGHGKLRSALFGSISRALAAKAPCPVVVVPAGTAVPRFIREPEAARRRDVGEATTRRPLIAQRGGARGGRSRRTRSR